MLFRSYIQQVGSPKTIYDNPANLFVAGFIGTPPMNFINGTLDDKGVFTTSDTKHQFKIPAAKFERAKAAKFVGKPIVLGVRPEDIHDEQRIIDTYPESSFEVTVDVAELLGAETNVHFTVSGSTICASISARSDLSIGSKVKLAFDMNKCHFFDPESTMCITADLGKTISGTQSETLLNEALGK